MSRVAASLALVLLSLFTALGAYAQTEPHRATRLGNPATRFAEPLKTPDDLRRTLLAEALRDDVQKVARMSGYTGDMEDFREAVRSAPIREIRIPVGTVLPAMSTRRKGQVDLLRNVLWAGKRPIDAYEFSFISGERRYRVVTPKACSNFWVEEQLPAPKFELSLACEAPAQSPRPYPAMVCCTLRNTGDLTEPKAVLTLPMPAGAKVRCVSGGADVSDSTRLAWTFANFAPGAARSVCATFVPQQAETIVFQGNAAGERAAAVSSRTETRVTDAPAELLEVVGPAEAVPEGGEAVYLIRVRNLAAWPLTQLRLAARLGEQQRFVGGTGPTPVAAGEADRIVADPLAALAPNEQAEWRIVVKAAKPGEARLDAELVADQFFCPVQKSGVVVPR
jgi:hypothetical protein